MEGSSNKIMAPAQKRTIDMRISSIDTFRVFAVLAVICIHAEPFRGSTFQNTFYKMLAILINQGARFAAPFFFISAGYFIGKKLIKNESVKGVFSKYYKRLLSVFLAWSAIYFLIPTNIQNIKEHGIMRSIFLHIERKSQWIMDNPISFLMEGTKLHLWFIVSLILAIVLLAILLRYNLKGMIFYITGSLYVLGLLGGSYSEIPLGIDIPFNTRNGPFFSALFVAIGLWLAEKKYVPKISFACAIIVLGLMLHMSEVLLLWKYFKTSPMRHDYLIGTIPYGTGVMLLALANKKIGSTSSLPVMGKYTLGVYVCHYWVLEMVHQSNIFIEGAFEQIIIPIITYVITFLIVYLLSKISFVRPVVI